MHLPDVFILKPIFDPRGGERLAWAATICHQTDVGGRVPGSNAADSTEIFQEGLRIPPLPLYEAGRPNETLFALIEKNVRLPVRVFGDLRSQLAACHVAEAAFLRLVERHGAATVRAYMAELIDYAERLTRAALRELPDGEWRFEDWIDDDGIDRDRPIPLRVALRKSGDRLVADWTGTSPQVKGAINNSLSFTKAATYTCLKAVLPPDIPANAGFYRPVEVIAPPGTIANAVPPAATAARALTGFRMVDCVFGALAQMLPDRVPAAAEGGNTGVSVGGYYPDRTPFIHVEFFCCAWGGRPWADGVDGNAHIFGNISLQPAEVCEVESPLEVLAVELVPDSGGPGRFRGGTAMRRVYRFTEAEGTLQIRSDRRAFKPYGLYGGQPGRPSTTVFDPGTEEVVLPAKITRPIRRGDVVPPRHAGRRRLGRPADARPGAGAARRAERPGQPGRRPRRLRRDRGPRGVDRGRRGHGSASGRADPRSAGSAAVTMVSAAAAPRRSASVLCAQPRGACTARPVFHLAGGVACRPRSSRSGVTALALRITLAPTRPRSRWKRAPPWISRSITGRLLVRPLRIRKYSLEVASSGRVSRRNVHGEVSTGRGAGRETW